MWKYLGWAEAKFVACQAERRSIGIGQQGVAPLALGPRVQCKGLCSCRGTMQSQPIRPTALLCTSYRGVVSGQGAMLQNIESQAFTQKGVFMMYCWHAVMKVQCACEAVRGGSANLWRLH